MTLVAQGLGSPDLGTFGGVPQKPCTLCFEKTQGSSPGAWAFQIKQWWLARDLSIPACSCLPRAHAARCPAFKRPTEAELRPLGTFSPEPSPQPLRDVLVH